MHSRRKTRATPVAGPGLVLGTLALAGCGLSEHAASRADDRMGAAPGAPRDSQAVEACGAGPTSREPLVLSDGRHAYIEPESLMQVGEHLVVVGSPTYTWEVGAGPVRMASHDAHIAAYLDGPPRLVPSPVDGPIGVVRSLVLDERWGVLFTETEPDTAGLGPSAPIVGLWYAEHDGERWSTVEAVPMPSPDQSRLFPAGSSPLVRVGSELVWVVIQNPEGAVLEYRRRGGRWTFEPTGETGVEAAGMASGAGSSGAWLALSGLDPAISGPRKSVRLFHREGAGAWRLVGRYPTVEEYTEIRTPSVLVASVGVTVTWTEARGAGIVMARVGVGLEDPGTLVTVDGSAPAVRPFLTADGAPAWALWHARDVPGTSTLRLVRLAERGVEVEQEIPYPYTGFFAATATGPGRVVVTGSEFSPDPARPTVRSLTLRLNPSCQ